MAEMRTCYICGTEFSMSDRQCPSCGTQYEVNIAKALQDTAGSYTGFRSSDFAETPSQVHTEDEDKARDLIQEGIEIARKEDYQRAEKVFRQAMMFDQKNGEAPFYLGGVLYKMGRYLEAEKQYKFAVSVDPMNDKYKKWLKKVTDLLSAEF